MGGSAKLVAALAVGALVLGGCAAPLQFRPETDTDRIGRYFDALNRAGDQGPERQRKFLAEAAHPDFTRECDLGDLTLDVYPAMSTIKPDPEWEAVDGERPRGDVYRLAISLTLRRAGAAIGEQILSQRVAVLDRRVYGFTPCPKS